MAWASPKSSRPVKFSAAAKILAASKPLDVLNPNRSAMENILGVQFETWALVDSKTLYQ